MKHQAELDSLRALHELELKGLKSKHRKKVFTSTC